MSGSRNIVRLLLGVGLTVVLAGFGAGCGKKKADSGKSTDSDSPKSGDVAATPRKSNSINNGGKTVRRRKPIFQSSGNGGTGSPNSRSQSRSGSAKEELKKLQLVVGSWQGLPRGSAVQEFPKWRWDFSQPTEPALAFEAKKSVHLTSGRLTWQGGDAEFKLVATDKQGVKRTYDGKYTKDPAAVPSDDGKSLEQTFEITFIQVAPRPKAQEPNFKVIWKQQRNNRYLLAVHDKRGSRTRQAALIANQRQGTSFAKKFDDYGDRTCVVSQGLGTMAITYKGQTYYVCCSGCAAAFKEEPETWIASFEEWKRKRKAGEK